MPVLSQLASERVKLVKVGSSIGVSNTTGNVDSDGFAAKDSTKTIKNH